MSRFTKDIWYFLLLKTCIKDTIYFFVVAPEGTKLVSTATETEQGDRVTFTCTTTNGVPPTSTYQFYHNSKLVQDSSVNTYTINSVKKADEGRYTCRPVNDAGAGTDATVNFKVKGLCLVHLYVYISNWYSDDL